jgi:hypothetical protein
MFKIIVSAALSLSLVACGCGVEPESSEIIVGNSVNGDLVQATQDNTEGEYQLIPEAYCPKYSSECQPSPYPTTSTTSCDGTGASFCYEGEVVYKGEKNVN